MSSEVWSWLIFCFCISLINLVAVIMKVKIKLKPDDVWIWRFLSPVTSIAFLVLLGNTVLIILNFHFPQQSDLNFEHAKIYQIIGSMTMLLGAMLIMLNLFSLTFFHGCYYIWQIWKNKVTDQEIEFRFSNFKVTVYSLGFSCLIIFLALPYYLLDIFQTVLGISFLVVFIERTNSLFNSKNKRENEQ
ncbi:hypothetical protein P8960_02005 [Enterococcus lactis]|nr:hypothetical protein [Enterococcus sp. E5-162]MDG4615702.1 hypothetical protein [Enterococcus lactis]MEB4749106.1 hypothetical protein [Enterococcus sp. E5-162]NTQ96507.1 hypothetical protein [Enterococcus faecium]HAQ5734369.1 hypothetical protein [Enterococcus faecium]